MYGVVGTDGVVYGPVPVAALYEWIAQGRVMPTTVLIDHQGRSIPAAMLPELRGAFPMTAAPISPFAPAAPVYGLSPKSRRVALWLVFLLGFLGAHRFYLGHFKTGLAMLVVSFVAGVSFVRAVAGVLGAVASGSPSLGSLGSGSGLTSLIEIVATVWPIVDVAMIMSGKLTDASGLPLR